MNDNQSSRIGAILFFIGLILILLSWHFTYPVYLSDLDDLIISQFFPSIWPGIVLSLLGLFIAGYYSKKVHIKLLCLSFFPLVLYSVVFFFSYVPTSDCGSVKAMFEIFHYTGIDSSVEPYFQYPIYFSLNEMTSQTLGLDVNYISFLYYSIFGILIALFLYLFLIKITKDNAYQIAFLGVILYFIATYTFLNYQWVPQTIAFIFFLLLLILFEHSSFEIRILSIFIFIALVFSHLFIPVIFLAYLGLYSIKKKELRNIFLLISCIYISVLIYYTTFYFYIVLETFRQSIVGFGTEYASDISRSLMEPKGILSQIISAINRFRIPLVWGVVSLGFFIAYIKKKLSSSTILLTVTGGFYLGAGVFYAILGMRALQIVFVPLVIGFGFFVTKWKKLSLVFIALILILSVFGPIRSVYDAYQFQVSEEEHACNFLATTLPAENPKQLIISHIISGYFTRKLDFIHRENEPITNIWMLLPRDPEFYYFFNRSIDQTTYIIYNSNMGREIFSYGMEKEAINDIKDEILLNNKVYDCSRTFIITGISRDI